MYILQFSAISSSKSVYRLIEMLNVPFDTKQTIEILCDILLLLLLLLLLLVIMFLPTSVAYYSAMVPPRPMAQNTNRKSYLAR